ncbi:MAG: response regulator [Flavobacteriales bacterium]
MSKRFKEVFIVDDDAIYRMAMKRLFNQTDFCEQIQVFENGQDARIEIEQRKKAGAKVPDLILVDLNMPIEDGWQFVESCCQLKVCEETGIYLCSSTIDPEELQKANDTPGLKRMLIKPIQKHDLYSIKMDNIQKLIS